MLWSSVTASGDSAASTICFISMRWMAIDAVAARHAKQLIACQLHAKPGAACWHHRCSMPQGIAQHMSRMRTDRGGCGAPHVAQRPAADPRRLAELAQRGGQARAHVGVRAHVLGLLLAPHHLGARVLRDDLRRTQSALSDRSMPHKRKSAAPRQHCMPGAALPASCPRQHFPAGRYPSRRWHDLDSLLRACGARLDHQVGGEGRDLLQAHEHDVADAARATRDAEVVVDLPRTEDHTPALELASAPLVVPQQEQSALDVDIVSDQTALRA